jgi:transglutaminase-like putative cysteine protease
MRSARSLLGLLLMSCATSLPPLELKGLPGAKEHPDAKWVVLLSEQEARFGPGEGGPEVRITERWRVKVLKPADVPPVRVGYSRTFEQVESIRGRVIAPDGKETALDLSKQADYPANSSSVLFQDSRVVVVPVPPVPVGGVFEYEVVTRHRDMQHFVVQQTFGGDQPTVAERLVLLTPKGWEVRWKLLAYDAAPLEPTTGERDGLQVMTFERRDLPATELDAAGPPLATRLPTVVARLETWLDAKGAAGHPPGTPEELSRQLAQKYEAGRQPTPELEATVAKVLQGVEATPEARARALYEYVCREVQYCAIEIGLGGWYPHAAKDVHAARYGDCKDKANYLQTLLTIAGIPAYPTTIYSHEGTAREFTLPSLAANFNHEILAVQLPSGLVYADPTWRAVPFGELPPNDQGAPVLLIAPEGRPLEKTPESAAADNVEHQRLALTLGGDGEASGTFTLTASGARALPWKSRWLAGTGQAKRWVEDQLWVRAPLVRRVAHKTKADFAKTVEVEGELGVRRVAHPAGAGRLVVRPVDLFEPWLQTWNTERKSPVVARVLDTRAVTVELSLPLGSTLEGMTSRKERVDGAHGTYTLSARVTGTTLTLERRLERKQRKVVVSALREYNGFASLVLAAESKPLFIKVGP